MITGRTSVGADVLESYVLLLLRHPRRLPCKVPLLLLEVCSPLSRKWLVCYILFEEVNERLLRSPTNLQCRACVCDTNKQEGGGVLSEGKEMSHITLNVGSGKIKHILKMMNRLNYDIIIRIVVFLF